jgi:hypothetical protein
MLAPMLSQFVDNQDVLDLIEGKMGILDLLDEQCRCILITRMTARLMPGRAVHRTFV